MTQGGIYIKFTPISTAYKLRWVDNPKQHDIGSLVESIVRHGLVELPKFDKTLGYIVAGNGRIEALYMMWRDGTYGVPRGVNVGKDGEWLIPILHGVDAATQDEAKAYAFDSNNLVLSGGDFTPAAVSKLWEPGLYEIKLIELAINGTHPVSVTADSLDALIRLREIKDNEGGGANNEQITGEKYKLGRITVEVVTIKQFLDIIKAGGIKHHRILLVGDEAVKEWERETGKKAKKL